MGTTEELACFLVETSPQQVVDPVLHEGKRCLINFLCVALYAARDPSVDILLDVFQEEGGKRHASVIGVGRRTTVQNAALANGYLGHLEDYDDTHFPTVIHPSSPTLPIGEQQGASGREVLIRIGQIPYPGAYGAVRPQNSRQNYGKLTQSIHRLSCAILGLLALRRQPLRFGL